VVVKAAATVQLRVADETTTAGRGACMTDIEFGFLLGAQNVGN
jgi:hypothetical protein